MKQIAIAGKGGVGKTTFTALMLRHLQKHKQGTSILAVDADPNANLNEVLGLKVENTMSCLLEDTKNPKAIPSGMTKEMYIEFKMQDALVETSKTYDLLVMGNPQGAGCYCYPNDLLRKHLEKLRSNYDYVLVDNEAGLEHLSRRIISDVDILIVVSDAAARSIRSATRVYDIVKSVNLDVKEIYLVITKVMSNEVEELQEEIEKTGLTLIGTVPLDPMVAQFDVKGRALIDLPDESAAVQAVETILNKIKL
ncbi:MAG: Septum site-determining protein MinD [Dehalococcoidia bacterium]|nr:Septum site-determining protein MinD [Bacillota bacterium]MBT9143216.1 Septum site-determining protein MinD [Bacillota bacterium]